MPEATTRQRYTSQRSVCALCLSFGLREPCTCGSSNHARGRFCSSRARLLVSGPERVAGTASRGYRSPPEKGLVSPGATRSVAREPRGGTPRRRARSCPALHTRALDPALPNSEEKYASERTSNPLGTCHSSSTRYTPAPSCCRSSSCRAMCVLPDMHVCREEGCFLDPRAAHCTQISAPVTARPHSLRFFQPRPCTSQGRVLHLSLDDNHWKCLF